MWLNGECNRKKIAGPWDGLSNLHINKRMQIWEFFVIQIEWSQRATEALRQSKNGDAFAIRCEIPSESSMGMFVCFNDSERNMYPLLHQITVLSIHRCLLKVHGLYWFHITAYMLIYTTAQQRPKTINLQLHRSSFQRKCSNYSSRLYSMLH